MKRFWLIFAQTITIVLALWAVITIIRPEWSLHLLQRFPASSVSAVKTNTVVLNEAQQGAPVGSYRAAVQKAMPSVVNIYSSKRLPPRALTNDLFLWRFFGVPGVPDLPGAPNAMDAPNKVQAGLGSGVIVSEQGYILTNNHVIEAADQIEVALSDGRKMSARVIGVDPETDLAVIKVDLSKDAKPLPAITLAQADQYQTGDVVLAIGNPFAVGQTVTMGIISATGRNHLGINTFENFIQTDAAINPGNSGGALMDTQGHLIGINSAIYSRTGGSLGIGFAIPVSLAKIVMESIIKTGSVTRGWIGVELRELSDEVQQSLNLPITDGIFIAGVLKQGPADQAGIKPGDILISINQQKTPDMNSALSLISQIVPGEKAALHLLRNQQKIETTVVIGKRPAITNNRQLEQFSE